MDVVGYRVSSKVSIEKNIGFELGQLELEKEKDKQIRK